MRSCAREHPAPSSIRPAFSMTLQTSRVTRGQARAGGKANHLHRQRRSTEAYSRCLIATSWYWSAALGLTRAPLQRQIVLRGPSTSHASSTKPHIHTASPCTLIPSPPPPRTSTRSTNRGALPRNVTSLKDVLRSSAPSIAQQPAAPNLLPPKYNLVRLRLSSSMRATARPPSSPKSSSAKPKTSQDRELQHTPPPAAQHQHYTQHGTVNAHMCHHSVTMVFRSRAPHIALQPEAPIFKRPLAFSVSLNALLYSIPPPPPPPPIAPRKQPQHAQLHTMAH